MMSRTAMLWMAAAGALLAPMAGRMMAQPASKAGGGSGARPVALVGEHTLVWADLTTELAEAVGGQVLEEHALGMVLREECGRQGIRIGEKEIAAERELLGEMLASAARVPRTEAEGLIRNVRRSRGLGETRFRGLLERNAELRALVRTGVGDAAISVTKDDVDTAYELKYGPRVKSRMILVRSQQAATQAMTRLAAGKTFEEVATDMSVDPSGARGGQVDPFSLSDPTYPVAVRRALGAMKVGERSEPIGVTWGDESGFVIVRLDANVPAQADAPTREAAGEELEKEVRTVRERAQMDKLARKYIADAGIAAMDPALNWSWEQRFGR